MLGTAAYHFLSLLGKKASTYKYFLVFVTFHAYIVVPIKLVVDMISRNGKYPVWPVFVYAFLGWWAAKIIFLILTHVYVKHIAILT